MPIGMATYFFATKGDLRPLVKIEDQQRLKYVVCGMSEVPQFKQYNSLLEIENLGIAFKGKHEQEPSYFIFKSNARIEIEVIPQKKGRARYSCANQILNPHTIVFRPGGFFEDVCLIDGEVSTISTHPKSIQIYNSFVREIKQHFRKIKSYYVGPEAAKLLDEGIRLTANVRAPAEYDLRR